MKTKNILFSTAIAMALTMGSLNAEKPAMKIIMLSPQGVSFEFLSKIEPEAEESLPLETYTSTYENDALRDSNALITPIDITRYIKPEREVDEPEVESIISIAPEISESK